MVRNGHDVSLAHALRARRQRTLRKKRSDFGPRPVPRTGRLQIEDGNGRLRGVFGTGGPFGSGVHLGIVDEEGHYRAGLGMGGDGQAHITVSAGSKDRSIRMTALPEGDVSILLTGEGAPLVELGLDEGEGKDPAAYLVLADKDGRAATALSGRRSGPFVRLSDYRGRVRASLELGANGKPELNRVDEEGYRSGFGGHLDRVLVERGVVFQAIIVALVLVVSAIAGASIMGWAFGPAGLGQIGSGPLPVGALAVLLVIVGIVALLVAVLFRQRR